MTLLSLLIVMAIERVSIKSAKFHIATWCEKYFQWVSKKGWLSSRITISNVLLIAGIPSLILLILYSMLPLLLAFALNLFILWGCLGCPVTRDTYKKYLAAANRQDFQACSLYSMEFGNQGGELDNVGKQLVLVNYRQYSSVLIFFVLTGVAGLIFYSIVKELKDFGLSKGEEASNNFNTAIEKVLFVLDWLPVRITTFGFLVVGHFSNALAPWLKLLSDTRIETYDALSSVAKAAEDVDQNDAVLNEPLQLVRLVKRNLVFLLMLTAAGTMVGLVN